MYDTAYRHQSLSDRIISICTLVYQCKAVATKHLHQAFFQKATARSLCYQWVDRLVAEKFLRIGTPSLLGSHGSISSPLLLGTTGQTLLAHTSKLPRKALARASRMKAPSYLFHHYHIVDMLVSVWQATTLFPWISLDQWLPQPHQSVARIQAVDPNDGKELTFAPDAQFPLASPKGRLTFHLECDCGTLPARIREKIRGYFLFNSSRKTPQPILWTTPTGKRLAELSHWIMLEAKQLNLPVAWHYLTTFDQVSAQTVLTKPIWRVPGSEIPRFLVATPHPKQTTIATNGVIVSFAS